MRLYGLGGQGLKSMIQDILAPIVLATGFRVQAFPFFGGERRGALVSGYFRCGLKKITTHSFITHPDMVVIFDHERISINKILENLKPGTIALINTSYPDQFIGSARDLQIYTIGARKISLARKIGRPEDPYLVINAAMAGAIIKILETIFKNKFSDKVILTVLNDALTQKVEENYAALLDGANTVNKIAADAPSKQQEFLKNRAAARLTQPDERCTKCNLCYLFCPKRAIEITASNAFVIFEEKCNYCGICVTVCPLNAIAMTTQEGDLRHG